jgi:hypothetical protein
MKSKVIRGPLIYDEQKPYKKREIEKAHPISQNQLKDAKLFTSKYEYARTLNKGISYLEVGVAWGHSAKMFIDTTRAQSADLLDLYDNAMGILAPGGVAPEDSSIDHEEFIKNKFNYHPNVNTIKGDAKKVFFTLSKNYDFIFFDMETERMLLRNLLLHSSKLVNIGGIIGLSSYINYDSIRYVGQVGVYAAVNEFLNFHNNWSVDAMVLNDLGFHDIYIKRNS